MKFANKTISQLNEKTKEIMLLGRISALLSWDLNVNMPAKAAGDRAEQIAYLTQKITQKWLDKDFRSLLEKANNEKNLSIEEKAIVHNLNRGSKYYYNVPEEVIVKKERVTAMAFPIWSQARQENDFKKFSPHLEKILELNREIANFLQYKENPYDALLDMYEPELTAAECERLFTGVKNELVPLIKKIKKSKTYIDSVPFLQSGLQYSRNDQEKLLKYAVNGMGFDLSRGRVDVSPHPFTIGLAHNDVRLTTHYNDTDFRESFTAAMHEAGHGLYEQGVNVDYAETPLGGGVSLGIHEALSRFWENMVGKNPAYLRSVLPLFKAFYTQQLAQVDDDTLIRSFNLVKPSLIRIHADEVTYSLHIILRFEMENALMNGKVQVKDAPALWNEKSMALLGIAPEKDSEGILQDVHWTYGSFGYFPSYALGNLYGAQFLSAMEKDIPFNAELAKGNLLPVKLWLDKNIHQHGSVYLPKELVRKVSGKPLDASYFVKYLTSKYSELYK